MSPAREVLRHHARRLHARSVVEAPWPVALLRRWWVVLVLLGFAASEAGQDLVHRSWWAPWDLLVVGLLAWRLGVLLRRRRGGGEVPPDQWESGTRD